MVQVREERDVGRGHLVDDSDRGGAGVNGKRGDVDRVDRLDQDAGTSLRGGEGTLVGTALAAWLFAVVGNGLVLIGMNSYWQYVATGIIVILALILGKVGFGGEIWPRRRGDSGDAPLESPAVAPAAAGATAVVAERPPSDD